MQVFPKRKLPGSTKPRLVLTCPDHDWHLKYSLFQVLQNNKYQSIKIKYFENLRDGLQKNTKL